ncbi:protein FAM193A-like [Ornithodoros turicata]|uniref:protein FAM193A-like n=1 Tax=Ornithodoros turicata TaxID=34597 RepID=UPI003138A1D5
MMSPAETKKAKRRKNKKVARSPARDLIEGVGMNSEVDNTDTSRLQNEQGGGRPSADISPASLCSLKDSVPTCIICSKAYTSSSELGSDENRDTIDLFGSGPVWVCSECRDNLPTEEALLNDDIDFPAIRYPDDLDASTCLCEPYTGWSKETPPCCVSICRASEAELLLEQQELRVCWQGVKQALHRIYQQAGLSLGEALSKQVAAFRDNSLDTTDAEVKRMVSRLRRSDPHRLFQCLKYQAQLFVVESRLKMLRHVVASGTQSLSQVEDSLVGEYAKLQSAWEAMNPLLDDLGIPDVKKCSLSWELMNKYLFQAIVYSDPAIQKCLPDLLSTKNSVKFKEDHKALLELDSEMALTAIRWRKVQQVLDEPVQFELAAVPKSQQLLQAQWERVTSGWKALDQDAIAKSSCNLPEHCPFAEANLQTSVLAAGEPSATQLMASVPPLTLHRPSIAWGTLGEVPLCKPTQPLSLEAIEVKVTDPESKSQKGEVPCECHACSQLQCPLPPPSPAPAKPMIHPHLYSGGSAPPRGINLELESLDTLQQQAYLATLGDWDDSHYKLPPPPPPPHHGLPVPPTTVTSSSADVRGLPLASCRHSDEGACLDSDCDNALLDGEDSLDDTCSEHSSSTTTSNQRGGSGGGGESRVCDCCYCEVFGHGAPPVAPVSKNYQEMRDRLRQILSKRKAEAIHATKKGHAEQRHEDDRGVDELLNYINGTDGGEKPEGKSASRRHKRKTKRRDECDKGKDAAESKSHSPSPISRLVEEEPEHANQSQPPPKAIVNVKESRKENGIRLNRCIKNSCGSSSSSSNSSGSCRMNHCARAEKREPSSVSNQSLVPNCRVPMSLTDRALIIEASKVSTAPSFTSRASPRKSQAEGTSAPHVTVLSKVANCHSETLATPTMDQQRNNVKKDTAQGSESQIITKNKKSRKKKGSSEDATSPDDVFLPKDIDLENGELDELEREVEAFKRFCFNSVPVANKEKVHVNLKDILVRRKPSSATVLSPGLLQRT